MDLILFADPGAEQPHTYHYLRIMDQWLREHGMPGITRVWYTDRQGQRLTLEQECLRSASLPSIAYGWKKCSLKHKVDVYKRQAVGSLYMFSIPRGYIDGFVQWMKQVIGLCLTAFLQSTILVAGLMVFKDHALLGLGLMLSAGEVPRIAGTFGLDTTTQALSLIHI